MKQVGKELQPLLILMTFDELFVRRDWLGYSGSLIVALVSQLACEPAPSRQGYHGHVPFIGEGNQVLKRLIGSELDGRLFTDLSKLQTSDSLTATDEFFIRTRASNLLPPQDSWSVRIADGERSLDLPIRTVVSQSVCQGRHLLECSGNPRGGHFGMISVATWSGVPVTKILSDVGARGGSHALISGFDVYTKTSRTSIAGAGWIFSLKDIQKYGAFLATGMNKRPLTPDHGAPVRLIVPGWYGCSCIKWVNLIRLVDDEAEATSQMREYASRTDQQGVPFLARDYTPSTIECAAMPIRVEKWIVGKSVQYVIVGIIWGGSRPVKTLGIRFDETAGFVEVDRIFNQESDTWTFWMHTWSPSTPGIYEIEMKIVAPPMRTMRLDMGYYRRRIAVSEV